jgi:hypothetical protein
MDEVTLGPTCQVSGLSFIIWYCSKPEVRRDQLPLVRTKARQPSDDHYFHPELLGLTRRPGRGPQVSFWGEC